MSGFFNVEWEGVETGDAPAEMVEPKRAASEGQERGTAWEIQFSNSPGQEKPKKVPPRFSKSSPAHDRTSSSSPSIKPSSMRSSSTPLKANGTRSFVKPAALKALSKPSTKTATKSNSSTRDVSPKKQLPAIRKPLLPVTSPTKKSTKFPELRSQSESVILPQVLNKAAENSQAQLNKKQRPHSASPSLNSAGRKQGQKVQLMQHQKAGQESKQHIGLDTWSPEWQKGMQGTRQSDRQAGSRVAKEAVKPAVNKGDLLTKTASLPVVSVNTSDSPESASRLAVTAADMAQRKVLDLKRWYCMSRPQYSKSCGISSVVSCWNYLFSTLGNGTLPPVSQEQALTLLGFEPPFGKIQFGQFTGNMTCMRWFQTLCDHYGTNGRSYYFYKPVGPRKTVGMKAAAALEKLQEGLRSANTAFIYHCYNHYFCPIGYEDVPKTATDAYKVNLRPSDVDTWILIGEPSRTQSAILCKRWEHIVKDLTCELPRYFNIRHTERGILTKSTRRTGTNLHCIMAFKKLQDGFDLPTFSPTHTVNDSPSLSEVEDLNSSDSDLPSSPENHSREGGIWDDKVPNVDDVNLAVVSPVRSDQLDSVYLPTPLIDSTTDEVSNQENQELDVSVGGLRRSGTFTKAKPTLKVEQRRPLSSDSSESGVDEFNVDRGGLRRSGTFTKAKPTLKVEQHRPLSSDSKESGVDEFNVDRGSTSSIENLSQEGNEFDVESPSLSGALEEGEVKGAPIVTLKRSNTFTKEKPSVLSDDLDPSYTEDVDLDETLKSSEYF